jgi:predicted phage-related endonuclease
VQYGTYLEPLIIDWHQAMTGQPLIYRGRSCTHPTRSYVGCTLDCYREIDRCTIDAKATGKWRKIEDVLSFYPAQLIVQKACIGAEKAALLVVHGGDEPVEYEVTWDADYEQEVWDRIDWFWGCVQNLVRPAALPAARVSQPAVRVVDMSQSNSWSEFAGIWLRTRDPAKLCAEAARNLKELVEDDVVKAHGHGVVVSRSKAGALSIKEARS